MAEEWVQRTTEAALHCTSGSTFACTYVQTVVDTEGWADVVTYPDYTRGYDCFCFGYDRIFVPENERAEWYQMAGNTGDYDGRYGEAPEGAYECSRVGYLYLKDGWWYCEGTGTGP